MSDQDNDQDDSGTDDPDTGTDESTQDTDGTEWTPPTRQDWDNLQQSLRKARREARAAKRPAPKTDTDTADPEKVAADATAAAEGKWKPLVVRTAARTAFVEAGLVLPKDNSDSAMARVVKLLDLDDLTIGDSGEVQGLREQVEDIRADFPELFATNGHRRTGRVDGADKGGRVQPKTAVERLAAQISGG